MAGAGAMGSPFGVAVSGSGDVYVGDDLNARIDEFTQTGDVRPRLRQERQPGRRKRRLHDREWL